MCDGQLLRLWEGMYMIRLEVVADPAVVNGIDSLINTVRVSRPGAEGTL